MIWDFPVSILNLETEFYDPDIINILWTVYFKNVDLASGKLNDIKMYC
jgi:hypothetical protein